MICSASAKIDTVMQEVFLSIIIPAYNESKRIGPSLVKIHDYVSGLGKPFEIIVVDDGSTDKTSQLINQLGLAGVKLLNHRSNLGKGAAVKTGVSHAQGEYILFTDADNSTPIEEWSKLWSKLNEGYSIAIGSRYLPDSHVKIKQSFFRRWLGRLANFLIQILAIWGIKDTQCGFKAFSGQAASQIFTRQTVTGWGFDFEILAIARHQNLAIAEVPVSWYNSQDSRVRPILGALKTFWELIKIRINLITGKYG